jgi:RNA polymerase sigma-70 factor (ECF subfamily)
VTGAWKGTTDGSGTAIFLVVPFQAQPEPDRMPEDDIRHLVERAREGDERAFTGLYDAFAPRVLKFLRFRVGDPDLAEDLLQRVFLKVIEELPRYQERGIPFGAWLFRVTRNTAIDAHRTARPHLSLAVLAGRPSEYGDPEPMVEAMMERDEIRESIAGLPAAQRDVLECRFFGDLSPRETAEVLGRSEGSVKVLQHRAIAALRHRFKDGAVHP